MYADGDYLVAEFKFKGTFLLEFVDLAVS